MIGVYVAIAAVFLWAVWIWYTHNGQLRNVRDTMVDLRSQVTRYEGEIADLERKVKQLSKQLGDSYQSQQDQAQKLHQLEQAHKKLRQVAQQEIEALKKQRPKPAPAPHDEPKATAEPKLSKPGLQGLIDSPKAQKVFDLMERGESQAAIARKCDLQISEVLLIMGLKKFMGKTTHE